MKFAILLLMICFQLALAQDVQSNGPLIHEAFLNKVTDITPQEPVSTPPPAPRMEQSPPSPSPDLVWIPGYWTFSEDQNKYNWVCGVWRRPPNDHQWILGKWVETEEGYVWLNGFWYEGELSSDSFISEPPPDPIDEESGDSPSSNDFWAPGYWEYSPSTKEYNWLKGSWVPFEEDVILIPAHYQWRPEGYIFIPAYWDWIFEKRGVAYVCNGPLENQESYGVIDPTVIYDTAFMDYPDYINVFWQSYHYHPDYWTDCDCVPTWWNWAPWWAMTWHHHRELWWWYSHPNYPQPSWLKQDWAGRIKPPSKKLLHAFEKGRKPSYITPKGIPSSNDWLKGMKKSHPIFPKNAKTNQELKNKVQENLSKQKTIFRPSGKDGLNSQAVKKPLFPNQHPKAIQSQRKTTVPATTFKQKPFHPANIPHNTQHSAVRPQVVTHRAPSPAPHPAPPPGKKK